MKNWLYQKRKKFRLWRDLQSRKAKRRSLNTSLTKEESFNVPIIINNFNRLTYPLQLITWLELNGYKNIIILDNASTYPPLLEYYNMCKHKVIFLGANMGYMALWKIDFFNTIKTYYVYTDPDVVPNNDCPADVVFQLYKVLDTYPSIEKCGTALKTDDLPSYYKNKEAVIADEKKHWTTKVSETVYDAPVDSTFALYRPLAQGRAEDCKAYRLSGNYDFHHLPWYEDSVNPGEENKYYISHVSKGSTMWTEKN